MEQYLTSPENSRPDGAEPASRAEGGASTEHEEEERLDSKVLIDAADRGELARVKETIQGMKTNGVDINHKDRDGWTALMLACSNGFIEVVIELLKVDVQGVNTAWIYACINGHTEVVIELLKVDGSRTVVVQ